jgi:hypothetical protein
MDAYKVTIYKKDGSIRRLTHLTLSFELEDQLMVYIFKNNDVLDYSFKYSDIKRINIQLRKNKRHKV